MHGEKAYRKLMNTERFSCFEVHHKDTDLWIGIDAGSASAIPKEQAQKALCAGIKESRLMLETYRKEHQHFFSSMVPLPQDPAAPPMIQHMINAGLEAGTGPMASVAAAVALYAGRMFFREYPVKELVMENGGDILLLCTEELIVSVYAGDSPLTGKICVHIPPSQHFMGICTSSGTAGRSFSFGKADAVMIAAEDPLKADAWATSFCNMVQKEEDLERVIEEIEHIPEIVSAVVVLGEKAAIGGECRISFRE